MTWHDGQPFSSADVKFSFEEILLKFHARTKAGLEAVLDGIDAPDPNTVVMRFKQPYGPLLQRLDVVEAPIMPQHVYQGSDIQNNPANQKPIGTGPFKFVEYVKGDHVTLARNDKYFKAGPALPRPARLQNHPRRQHRWPGLREGRGRLPALGARAGDGQSPGDARRDRRRHLGRPGRVLL